MPDVITASRLADGVVVFQTAERRLERGLQPRRGPAGRSRYGRGARARQRGRGAATSSSTRMPSPSKSATAMSCRKPCARRSAPQGRPSGAISASRPRATRRFPARPPFWRPNMYHYDDFDQAFVAARVEQFRDQVARRLSGELTEEQFRPHRLMNGLYLQLHSYMLRIAVPYGTLNSRQMRKLAEIARNYDRGYGHFTTRQNIQFNWPALKDAPDILAELASVEMHAIQTSGNCIRNVTADHFAGVADDEIADPRPYAEILRQWSSLHPEFSFLPRKFKIAVNGAAHDRAVIQAHDIGLQVVRNETGELGFAVYVGGGLGRTPFIGRKVRDFLPERDLLGYVEAILRVYNLEGRRDNKYKARIKILMHEKSLETLREEIEAEFAARDRKLLDLPPEEVARMRAFFAPPELERKKPVSDRVERRKGKDSRFASFLAANVPPHRDARLRRRDRLAEGHRRPARRRQRRPDGRRRRSRRGLFARRDPGLARAEPDPAACRARRSAGGLRPPRLGRPRDAERRRDQRHHRLPGPGLLRARHRALDPRRPAHRAEIRRRRARKERRPAEDQDLRLHQRLRPPPCRPYRHSRPRARRRGDLPDHARRLGRRNGGDRPDRRPRLQLGECRRGGRDDRPDLPGPEKRRSGRRSSKRSGASASPRSRRRSTNEARDRTSDERARRQTVRRPDRRVAPRGPVRRESRRPRWSGWWSRTSIRAASPWSRASAPTPRRFCTWCRASTRRRRSSSSTPASIFPRPSTTATGSASSSAHQRDQRRRPVPRRSRRKTRRSSCS